MTLITKKTLKIACDTCQGTHLRVMTVEKHTQVNKNTVETVYIGLSCLTIKEKIELRNK